MYCIIYLYTCQFCFIETKFQKENDSTSDEEDERIKIIPNAAFPYCSFNFNAEGIQLKEYNDTYCNQFQVIYLTSKVSLCPFLSHNTNILKSMVEIYLF